SRDMDQSLRLSYNNQRWSTFIDGFYRYCYKPNMAHYERTEDDEFIYTQINQKEIDLLHLAAYASYWILPGNFRHLFTVECSDVSIMEMTTPTSIPHGSIRAVLLHIPANSLFELTQTTAIVSLKAKREDIREQLWC
ncbi:MAG: hypothetical protein KBS47_06470, partial [Bacteroidales bacterium]|nr:hypothetical protein [Candidatus Equimonas enterica]